MPTFELTISDKALERLQAIVARYNENTGQSLTLKQWAIRHFKEIAIGQELGEAVEQIRKQQQQAEQDAVKARMEELITGLGDE